MPDPVIHDFAPVARQLLSCDSRRDVLKGAKGKRIAQAIDEAIREENSAVLSLDVFDTLLLRNDKCEARRFLELSREARAQVLASRFAPDDAPSDLDFLFARVNAMALSYRTRKSVEGCREGHIFDVIRATRRALDLPGEAEAVLLAAEIAYEAENLAVNRVLLDAAQDFRARGGKVILVSDMYLGKEEISAILESVDGEAAEIADDIFSSANHIVSKRSGKLYKLIESAMELPAAAFFHVGDALEGDVLKCREAGWQALHFPVARAELARRTSDLEEFRSQMTGAGYDVASWAKV